MIEKQPLIHQAQYAKILRPLLPAEAFAPDPNKLIILFINLAILILGWAIAADLDRWHPSLLWLYLPLAIVMGITTRRQARARLDCFCSLVNLPPLGFL